jgi:uncharacterized membrane protein YdjX (TVP38/TMEM64 family)
MAAIARAERFIYIENQYLTAKSAAEALHQRLRENPALEVLAVTNYRLHGWLEAESMGAGRQRFMAEFREPRVRQRIRFVYPVAGEEPINVHAKVLIVDDTLLRIGSANLNNRSMGFDTECDLMLEAETAEHRGAIVRLRDRLIAEHWGTHAEAVERAFASRGASCDALRTLPGRGARMVRDVPREPPPSDTPTIVATLADPEHVVTADRFLNEILGLKRRRGAVRWAIRGTVAAAVLGTLALLWQVLPLEDFGVVDSVRAGIVSLRGSPWAVPIVLAVFVVGSLVAFPITVLIGTTILTLGPGPGFVGAALGTLLGAAASYGMGRLVGRKPLQRLLGDRLRRFDRKLERRGIITVALIRKVPVAPFTIVNMAMGASAIRFRDFIAGTALGMVPGIAAFALVGDSLVHVWNDPNPVSVTIVIAAAALWIGVVLGMQRWVNRLSAKQ